MGCFGMFLLCGYKCQNLFLRAELYSVVCIWIVFVTLSVAGAPSGSCGWCCRGVLCSSLAWCFPYLLYYCAFLLTVQECSLLSAAFVIFMTFIVPGMRWSIMWFYSVHLMIGGAAWYHLCVVLRNVYLDVLSVFKTVVLFITVDLSDFACIFWILAP